MQPPVVSTSSVSSAPMRSRCWSMRGSSHATLSAGRGGHPSVAARQVRARARLGAVRTDQAVLEHKVHHAVLQGVDACHERRAEQAVQRALPWPIDIGAKAESVPHAQANTDGDGTRHSRRGCTLQGSGSQRTT